MLNSAPLALRAPLTSQSSPERLGRALLELAGITVGGSAPHDIVVHDRRVYARVLRDGSLGLGEAYLEGWWDLPCVDETLARILAAGLAERVGTSWRAVVGVLAARIVNLQSRRRAPQVAKQHYDIGNDLYQAMLDRRLVYTCGYWRQARDLDEAQEAKLDLICRKLRLDPGMRLLDLGCGFGGLGKYAAEKYGVRVTGLTLSRQQLELGRKLCAGLPVDSTSRTTAMPPALTTEWSPSASWSTSACGTIGPTWLSSIGVSPPVEFRYSIRSPIQLAISAATPG